MNTLTDGSFALLVIAGLAALVVNAVTVFAIVKLHITGRSVFERREDAENDERRVELVRGR